MISSRTGCILLTTVFIVSPLYAASKTMTSQLSTYDQLVTAVESGDDVVGIVQFDKCTMDTNNKAKTIPFDSPKASTRINFTIYSHYDVQVGNSTKNTVATSMTILTEAPGLGAIYAFGRLRVFDDGSAQFHASYYDPVTYQLKGGGDWNCQINNGVTLIDKNAWI